MKKTALISLALILFFFAFVKPSYSQEFDFNKAYQDYIYTQTLYDQAYSDYEEAREFYLKNQTLTLKEEARKKTLAMLKARSEYLRVYLSALRMRVIETKGLTSDERNALLGKIDPEIEWYKKHNEAYKESDPLEDLFNKSKEGESRYSSDTLPVSYNTLLYISIGEVSGIRSDSETVYKALRESIEKGVSEGKLKIDPFNRWFTDIEGVLAELQKINSDAKARMAKIYDGQGITPKSVYNSSLDILTPSVTSLTKLNSFLTELLNAIAAELDKNNNE